MDLDPLRIAIRCGATYLFLLAVLRLAGKRAIRHGSAFDFVLALVLGDLVDDAIWREVPFVQFAVAVATLILAKLAFVVPKIRSG